MGTPLIGKQKLADRWETDPYTVIERPDPTMPVYVVKRSSGLGSTRTLHRNMLLPLALPLDDHNATKQAERLIKPVKHVTRRVAQVAQDSTDSSDDEELMAKDPTLRPDTPGDLWGVTISPPIPENVRLVDESPLQAAESESDAVEESTHVTGNTECNDTDSLHEGRTADESGRTEAKYFGGGWGPRSAPSTSRKLSVEQTIYSSVPR